MIDLIAVTVLIYFLTLPFTFCWSKVAMHIYENNGWFFQKEFDDQELLEEAEDLTKIGLIKPKKILN